MYLYVMSITLDSVSPSFGTVRGGTKLTLEGSGYDSSRKMYCWFGENIMLEPVKYVSNKQVECTTPQSNIAKSVTLRVIDDGYANSTSVIESLTGVIYEYVADAVISSVHPSSGPMSGGTPVLFIGDNFVDSGNLTCWYGMKSVLGRMVDDHGVECLSPSYHISGLVPVSMSLNGIDKIIPDMSNSSISSITSGSNGTVRFEYYDEIISVVNSVIGAHVPAILSLT